LFVVIQLRHKVPANYRAILMILLCFPLLASYEYIGIFGGLIVLSASIAEYVAYKSADEQYSPEPLTFNSMCGFIFARDRTLTGFIVFLIWTGCVVGVFLLGFNHGRSSADDWSLKRDIDIPRNEWGFTQGCGTVISFSLMMLMLFQLRGFQNILINWGEGMQPKYKQSCKARFKEYLTSTFTQDNMLRVHMVISTTIIVFTVFHVFGNFFTYDNSGSKSSYDDHFGVVPFITGGLSCVCLAIIISSAWISPEKDRRVFMLIHRTALILMGLLIVHGRDGWNPNFWKYILGPCVLYGMDKCFRVGVFNFSQVAEDDEFGAESTAPGPPGTV